jgi:uncharacterized protein YyaL (SSP411 family)
MKTKGLRAFRKSLGPMVLAAAAVGSFSIARTVPSQDRPTTVSGQRSERGSDNTAAAFVADQMRKGKKPNRLVHEKSPYLLQHAFNPVDWHPWGEEAFARARKENKLIFLSVGYSSCYWCHVMERQVFENEEIAPLVNKYFVNVKVDREERPDVDRIYMNALQTLTGGGGWPMSLFLTPDLKPFFGRSYIPPERFRELIDEIHKIWTADPGKILQSSREITEVLKLSSVVAKTGVEPEKSILRTAYEQFQRSFDPLYGGFGGRPKFPRPVTLNFLLRYHSRFNQAEALRMVLATLQKMRAGGIYDHLGGGFHRYSVDGQWRVPHFEKMLYDQALLVSSYLDAYQITRDLDYAATARETLTYVLGVMTGPEGGFYSAEDAESPVDFDKPDEKEEGAFYLWTEEEIERVLGGDRSKIFKYRYGVRSEGNALEDVHKVFSGKNILYVEHTIDETAKKFQQTPDQIARDLADSRAKLLLERQRRPRPHLDDKILTSWNGLMISAFARAFQALEDPAYLRAGEKAADFIYQKLYDAKAKRLLRRYRDGEARFAANLDDYAFFTMGLLDLYEASLNIRWLKLAIELTGEQNALFYDGENGGFFDTSGKDSTLLFRTKEDYDGAEPAGNSIASWNLSRLAQMTDSGQWREMAQRSLALFGERAKQQPQSMPQLLVALDFHLDKPKQIIIAGSPQRADTRKMLREVHRQYIPGKVVLLADGGAGQQFLIQYLPFLKTVKRLDGKATAYVCENYACKLPTTDVAVMLKQLGVR